MTENPQAPISDTDKLASVLAELERERQKRVDTGQWSKGVRPVLIAIPQAGEAPEAAQQRALYAYLAEHPDAPKAIAAYDWMAVEVVDPAPTIELPDMIRDHDHGQAVDVTPRPPWRPPVGPASPPSPPSRSLPPAPGSGALGVDPARMNIPARIHDAEQRRTRNFNDDTWGDPSGWPIRYPRGNRNGW